MRARGSACPPHAIGTGIKSDRRRLERARRVAVYRHENGQGQRLRESAMMSEIQIHTIARQMMEKHGLTAIAQAAQNAQTCERKGDVDEAKEWRHVEDAMKLMRGPHQS